MDVKDLTQEKNDCKELLEKAALNLNQRRPKELGAEWMLLVDISKGGYSTNFYLKFEGQPTYDSGIHARSIFLNRGGFHNYTLIGHSIILSPRQRDDRSINYKKIKSTGEFNFDKMAKVYWVRLQSYLIAQKKQNETISITKQSGSLVKVVLDECGIKPYNLAFHVEASRKNPNKVLIKSQYEVGIEEAKFLAQTLKTMGLLDS